MANALVALHAQGPDFANAFNKGAEAAQGRQMNALRMQGAKEEMGRKQAEFLMQTLGSIGMGVMGGDPNGTPDPERWEQGLDYLDSLGLGLETAPYRGKPQLAPVLVNSALSAWQHIQKASDDRDFEQTLREFEFRMQDANRKYDLELMKAAGDSNAPTTHGTPIYFQDEGGNVHVGFAAKAGGQIIPSDVPGRVLNPYDTSRMRSEGRVVGETSGKNLANLPKVEQQASAMLATLDRLQKHPAFSTAVGIEGNIPEALIPAGTQTAGFISLLKQIQGQAFLQAFESLKGGGQITEIEGKKATEAITRLSRNLSEDEFKQAVDEIREVIQAGLKRAREGVSVQGESMNGSVPSDLPRPGSREEYEALPSGTIFIAPDGSQRRKP